MNYADYSWRAFEVTRSDWSDESKVTGTNNVGISIGTIMRAIGYLNSIPDIIVWHVQRAVMYQGSNGHKFLTLNQLSRVASVTLFKSCDAEWPVFCCQPYYEMRLKEIFPTPPPPPAKKAITPFPHICPKCKKQTAYVGFSSLVCSNSDCNPTTL